MTGRSMRMGWRNLTVGVLIALALSCGARAADTRSLEAGGRERTYIVHRPVDLDGGKPAPLVIVLHGGFGTGAQAERSYNWDAEADRRGFVVVYPDGIKRSWNAGGKCCGRAFRDGVDDVAFVTLLIETVARAENIDRRRVYLTGISNGAGMAYRYACEGRFPVAAIGAVAGSLAIRCARPRAVSVMEIHGLEDSRVPFAGGHGNGVASDVDWLGVERTLAPFRAADDCGSAGARQAGVVRTTTWRCASGREVVLVTVADAGHQWPGANPQRGFFAMLLRLDPPSTALDATDVLWTFFARHSSD
jgi:polyhydroxybutyrate depolymerase